MIPRQIIIFLCALAIAVTGCRTEEVAETGYIRAMQETVAVTKKGLTYDGEAVTIQIESNTYWNALISETCDWLALSAMGADGSAVLSADIDENEGDARSVKVEFVTRDAGSVYVTFSQAASQEVTYYYRDSFEGASIDQEGNMVSLPEGIGAGDGAYMQSGAEVSASSPSDTYEGASGGMNILLREGSGISFGPVSLHGDKDFVLSFGSMSTGGSGMEGLQLSISKTGEYWADVPYVRTEDDGWRYSRASFNAQSDNGMFYIRLQCTSGEYRIDDLSLEEGDGLGDQIQFPEDDITYVKNTVFKDDFSWLPDAPLNEGVSYKSGTAGMPGSDGNALKDVADMKGWTVTHPIYRRVDGWIKSGHDSGIGAIETPAFSAIGDDEMNVWISLDLAAYNGDYDLIKLSVSGGGSFSLNGEKSVIFNIGDYYTWHTFEYEIEDATRNTKVKIEAGITSDQIVPKQKSNRFYLDNVHVYSLDPVNIETDPYVTVSSEKFEISRNGEALDTYSITTNGSWTASVVEGAEWISVDPASGEMGTSSLTVSATPNGTGEIRTGRIRFSATTGVKVAEKEVEVSQLAENAKLPAPEFLDNAVTWNSLFIRWDNVEGCGDIYHFELVRESDMENPVNAVTEIDFTNKYGYLPAVVLGHLEPETSYTFRVSAVSSEEDYDDSPFAEYGFKTPSKTDESGYILYEAFDNFVWGCDYLRAAWGFIPSSMPESSKNDLTSLDEPADKVHAPGSSQLNFAFGSGSYFTEDFINTQWELEGWNGARCHAVFGMLKIGNWKGTNEYLQTPALEKINGTADVRFSFSYAPWWDQGKTTTDSPKITLEVIGGGTAETTVFEETFSVPCKLVTVSTVIRNATSGTSIKLVPDIGNSGHRLFIDDIKVEKL